MKFTKKDATAFFAQLFGGEHTIPSKVKKYDEGYGVHTAQTLATFDSDLLTRLVTQANENGVRAAIHPHSSTRQLIVIQKRKVVKKAKSEAMTEQKAATVFNRISTPLTSQGNHGFITLSQHPDRDKIMAGIPVNIRRMIEQGMKKGMDIKINSSGFLSLPAELHQDFQKADYEHMCEAHPEFAKAFKSYLNGMTLDEAVSAALRDLSPPACIAEVLHSIGQVYNNLPENLR